MSPNFSGISAADQAQSYIVALLKDGNIPALSEIRFDQGGLEYLRGKAQEQGVLVDPGRIAAHTDDGLLQEFWMVSEDVGITPIDRQDIPGYEFVGMEVASRVLKETQFQEVERVYSLIKSRLRTQVNSSCGLHVHVGINHLSLESTKKLVTLLMILEEQSLFKDICAPHREYSGWCDPVSEKSRAVMRGSNQARDIINPRLALHVPQVPFGVSANLRLGLDRIWNCETIDAIANETKVHGGYHASKKDPWCERGGFAIRNDTWGLDIDGEMVLGDVTIEFRYKESTGSAVQDKHWLKLCLCFVRAAEWSVEQFRRAMRDIHEARDLEGNLASLGVEESERQWWSRIARHHREHPYPVRMTQFLAAE
ncbi:hypothetical protein KVR01_002900 [Diaporthe batatas]|uniref:uncharacterized protein n=1 Tax=Diaporthe batatas TaxID=748121 RepID=UPI001D0512DB|nr:uncharacterized protein KVR01_002900 [Diaporthe batatas]KAG8167211.1 hypothetical protein KVR01_002900 [Diaporthe batatas]